MSDLTQHEEELLSTQYAAHHCTRREPGEEPTISIQQHLEYRGDAMPQSKSRWRHGREGGTACIRDAAR